MSSENLDSQSPLASIEVEGGTQAIHHQERPYQGAPPETTQSEAAQTNPSEPFPQRSRSLPTFKKPKPLWPVIALAMVVIGGFVGWRAVSFILQPRAGQETKAQPAELPVRVAEAKLGLAQGWSFDEGTVWPVQRRVLNFEANGDITFIAKVNERDLREGDFVAQGQLLATIDSRKQEASIDTADADIEVSQRQRQQAEAKLLQAQAGYRRAASDLGLARSELQRYEVLFDQGAVSESDRDVYQNQVVQAEAALQSAAQDVRSAEDNVQAAAATVSASQARFEQSAIGLEDTQLVSPIDGVVAYINIREGEYWSAQRVNSSNSQALIETAPIVVVDPTTFEVELDIQAEEARTIKPGQTTFVVLEEEISSAQAAGASDNNLLSIAEERGSQGQVYSVSPSQAPGSRGTRVSIRNLLNVRNLRVGGRVYVWIETVAKEDAVVVPLGALLPREQKFYAFVVNEADGIVERRQVERGVEGLTEVEVLSGLEPGELVVVEGQNRLVDGTPVEVVGREDI